MLRLLGSPSHGGAGPFPAKAYEILALIVLTPDHQVNRSRVVSHLWEQTGAKDSFGSLRYTLSALRTWERNNDTATLSAGAEILERRAELHQPTDLDLLLAMDAIQSDAQMNLLLDLFRGELLEGVELLSEPMKEWAEAERSRINLKVMALILGAENLDVGVRLMGLKRLLQANPYDEATAREYIVALHAAGHGHLAKTAFQDFQRSMKSDLDLDLSLGGLVLSRQLFGPEIEVGASPSAMPSVDDTSLASLPRVLLLPPLRPRQGSFIEAALGRALMTEVTIALGSARSFVLLAPHTAKQVHLANPMEEAIRLRADYVVSTQVLPPARHHRVGRLGFSLINVKTREILLADVVSLAQDHLEGTGTDLTAAIAASISAGIESKELWRFHQTGRATAYVHYLLGRERMGWDLRGLRKARKHFRHAVDLRPLFSNAHAMLARSLSNEWLLLERAEQDLLVEAQSIAQKAVAMDPLGIFGHWEMATTYLYQQKVDESLSCIRKALDRAPFIADLKCDEADILVHAGEPKAARAAIEDAISLNPLPPDDYRWVQGSADFMLGNFNAAIASLTAMKDQSRVARLLAASFAMVGNREQATHYRRKWLETYPDFRISDWSTVIPMRNREMADLMIEGMRRAGFS